MLTGSCSHCVSSGQRFYDLDKQYRHRALKCLSCGHIEQYVSLTGIIQPPDRSPPVPWQTYRLSGGWIISAEGDMAYHPEACVACGVPTLTLRELEVLRALCRGLSNFAIAKDLDIGQQSVKNHLTAIYGKLGAQSRLQAALAAQRLGLV